MAPDYDRIEKKRKTGVLTMALLLMNLDIVGTWRMLMTVAQRRKNSEHNRPRELRSEETDKTTRWLRNY